MNIFAKIVTSSIRKAILTSFLTALFTIPVMSTPGPTPISNQAGFNDQIVQVLALELETSFIVEVVNNDVVAFSDRISAIFQGLFPGGFDQTKNDYIIRLINSDIQSFTINMMYATRNDNNLVITYNMTLTQLDANQNLVTSAVNVISTWQKDESNNHCTKRCCRRPRTNPSTLSCGIDGWKLISQSSFEGKI